jgi:hypothetical protein
MHTSDGFHMYVAGSFESDSVYLLQNQQAA